MSDELQWLMRAGVVQHGRSTTLCPCRRALTPLLLIGDRQIRPKLPTIVLTANCRVKNASFGRSLIREQKKIQKIPKRVSNLPQDLDISHGSFYETNSSAYQGEPSKVAHYKHVHEPTPTCTCTVAERQNRTDIS